MKGESREYARKAERLLQAGTTSVDAALEAVHSQREGLSTAEAARRLEENGPNRLPESGRTRMSRELLRQFTYFFAVLLWVASVLAFVGGMPELGVAIIVVIVANGVFGFLQEYRAERATRALARLVPQDAEVLREGKRQRISAESLVVGDVLVLRPGDRVAADARLLRSEGVQVDNSLLTGESEAVPRSDAPPAQPFRSVLDVPTLVFAGAHLTTGSARAVIVATGADTLLGRLAGLTGTVARRPTPLHLNLRRAARVIAVAAVTGGVLFFAVSETLGMSLQSAFLLAVGIIVALVPEGLLPTVTLALAMAARRMARRGALVRHLEAVETLGSTTIICTDKTGTLTIGEMTVQVVSTSNDRYEVTGLGYEPRGAILKTGPPVDRSPGDVLQPLLRAAALCGNARLAREGDRWICVGEPLEGALLALAARGGVHIEELESKRDCVREFPFDAARRRMSSVHRQDDGSLEVLVKGSPESVLPLCTSAWDGSGGVSLGDESRRRLLEDASELAAAGLRVVTLARRPGSTQPPRSAEEAEQALQFLGHAAMSDRVRPQVKEAIRRCEAAGIRVLMVTGDHPGTAVRVAAEVGLPNTEVLLGEDFPDRDDDLAVALARQPVLARVAPEQKLRILTALQGGGEVVAMTGDGVNDAPALRRADIGIAMGRSGTDVARGAADLILLDDSFTHIVEAVEEGRAAFDNIRRFLTYHLTDNIAEIAPFLAWALSGGSIPLLLSVLQILALDIGTDLLPALALGAEPAEPGTMSKPPRARSARLLDAQVLGRSFGFLGPVEALLSMAMLPIGVALNFPTEVISTLVFSSIVLMQMANAFQCRRTPESLFRMDPRTNPTLLAAVLVEAGVLLAFVYLPPFQRLLGTRGLAPWQWAMIGLTPVGFVLAEELRKALFRRFAHPAGKLFA